MDSFAHTFRFGCIGESAIATWFKHLGYSALPVYEKEMNTGKGPQLFAPDRELIAPDLLVFNKDTNKVFWIEAKHKSAFTWHRITQTWNTGIDQKHYDHYLSVNEVSPWPIWLLFLHEEGQAKDTPPDKISPTGLFGGELGFLNENIHHTHDNWGRSGMVYWAHETLKLVASLNEVRAVCDTWNELEPQHEYALAS